MTARTQPTTAVTRKQAVRGVAKDASGDLLAERYWETFSTEAGKAVLADLRARLVDRTHVIKDRDGRIDPVGSACQAAAAEVVLDIEWRMKNARMAR